MDLEVPSGQFLAVVGPSGGGKSTLLHLLGGIDRPTSGAVSVGGRDLGALSYGELTLYRRREAGLVFQFFNPPPHITVRENVELPLALDGRADTARRAQDLLDRVGLLPRASPRRSLRAAPVGRMQRLAIARALSSCARLLLADEPTGNLDSANGEQAPALLDDIRRERGVTLILATHSPAAASRAERIVEIRDGSIAPR